MKDIDLDYPILDHTVNNVIPILWTKLKYYLTLAHTH